ncbi:unnamed protein product, partial [Amoebophrya sp. A25]
NDYEHLLQPGGGCRGPPGDPRDHMGGGGRGGPPTLSSSSAQSYGGRGNGGKNWNGPQGSNYGNGRYGGQQHPSNNLVAGNKMNMDKLQRLSNKGGMGGLAGSKSNISGNISGNISSSSNMGGGAGGGGGARPCRGAGSDSTALVSLGGPEQPFCVRLQEYIDAEREFKRFLGSLANSRFLHNFIFGTRGLPVLETVKKDEKDFVASSDDAGSASGGSATSKSKMVDKDNLNKESSAARGISSTTAATTTPSATSGA